MRQFAVFGLGIFGSSIAIALHEQGFIVLGVDIEEEPVKELAGKITEVVQADTTDEKVLEALGVRNFDVAIVSIGNDIQSSVLTAIRSEELFPGHNIIESQVPPSLYGFTLAKAQLRTRYGITVIAIKRGENYIVSPNATESLSKGDIIYILGSEQQLKKFFKEMAEIRNGKVKVEE